MLPHVQDNSGVHRDFKLLIAVQKSGILYRVYSGTHRLEFSLAGAKFDRSWI